MKTETLVIDIKQIKIDALIEGLRRIRAQENPGAAMRRFAEIVAQDWSPNLRIDPKGETHIDLELLPSR
jgi:hypothetical protein